MASPSFLPRRHVKTLPKIRGGSVLHLGMTHLSTSELRIHAPYSRSPGLRRPEKPGCAYSRGKTAPDSPPASPSDRRRRAFRPTLPQPPRLYRGCTGFVCNYWHYTRGQGKSKVLLPVHTGDERLSITICINHSHYFISLFFLA